MGSGVAKALYTKWPIIKEDYLNVCNEMFSQGGLPETLLGHVTYSLSDGKVLANCFTQQNYGYDGQVYLNYSALKRCMKSLKHFMKGYKDSKEVAIPKIGCGLAGGDWEIVKEVINSQFPKDFKIKVYYL